MDRPANPSGESASPRTPAGSPHFSIISRACARVSEKPLIRLFSNVFRREENAARTTLLYTFMSLTFSLQSHKSILTTALSTLGLGVNRSLPTLSKWTVILMMFAGRVGSMSVAMAVTRGRDAGKGLRYVPEKILIG